MIKKKQILPLAIIGAGPAGVTAAVYAKRSNLEPLIFTSEIVCGKVAKTLLIENYPAFKSTTGAKLCAKFAEQVKYLKIPVIYEKVINLKKKEGGFFELTTDNQTFYFEKVIIATGTKEKPLPIKGIEDFQGRGVSYCSSCDGYFFKDSIIAVIGGGNSAIEESKVLAQIGKQVIIINREAQLFAEKMLVDEIKQLSNVIIYNNSVLQEAVGKNDLESLLIVNTLTQKQTHLKTDGLFIYIGSLPNTGFINKKWNILGKNNYVLVDDHFETKIHNLYAVGDVVQNHVQQYTTAMASATVALQDIIQKGFVFLSKEK